MRTSTDHILTSHAGSLPRPDELIEANRARDAGEATDEAHSSRRLRAAVIDVVRRQKDLGIDIPGDGEFGKSMGHRVNYGAWWSYSFQRLAGSSSADPTSTICRRGGPRPGEIVLTSLADRRDRAGSAAYADPEAGISMGPRPAAPVCVGPVSYVGQDAIRTDIANFKAALAPPGSRRAS